MFWWFGGGIKNILYFRELLISSLNLRSRVSARGRRQESRSEGKKKDWWRIFLSLNRSEIFSQHAKALTIKIILIFVYIQLAYV